ncbi:hypothetical protein B0A55_04259 [Friedmanniomyces simplex]|uniref:CENP-V/GFA domain-containing protein n=1 Tax=Friedmanniomyces simplex TaxID=329884 RepID=A0A4U0X208_9PEZI|nr:hypothetical protein B0A55_04259 [Friedmanniomyces simplex]
MPKGSCLCGEYQHEYLGNPVATAVCHCKPCHKTAGQTGSVNNLLKADQYTKSSGKVFSWTRKGDSGKDVTYSNCATCGCIMTVKADAMPEMIIFKAGTLDDQDAIESSRPGLQIYNKYRPSWCVGLAYAEQKDEQ